MNTLLRLSTFVAAGLLTASAAQAAPAAHREFTVIEHADSDTTIDVGATGDSLGDLLVFNNPIFDAANGRKLGRDNGSCVRTVVGKAWECAWTNALDGGSLSVSGTFHDEGDSIFAVTGGTGRYSGWRGQMKLRFRDPKGTQYDFAFSVGR